jgi:tetratricopeptide (TPR) repeat protein
MALSRTLIAGVLTGVALLSGCNYTPYHERVVQEAKDRIDLVNAQLNYDQARQAYDSGRFDHAMKEITLAIARSPERAKFYVLRGRILLEKQQLEAAAASFATALEKDPKLADGYYFAGIVCERWSREQEAHENYVKAFDLDPTNVNYLLAAAETLVELKEYDQAEQLVNSKLSYFENNAAMRHLLGQIAMLQGNVAEAARLYAEARVLNPEDLSLLEELARVQYDAKMYSKALQSAQLLEERIGAERPDNLLLTARCLAALGRKVEARAIYLQVMRMPQGAANAEAWIELGAIAWDLGDDRRVDLCGQQLVAMAPERFEGYLLCAVRAQMRGDRQTEVTQLREACARAKEEALPHLMLGQAMAKGGDPARAREAYIAALRADPAHDGARQLLAEVDASSTRLAIEPVR